ALPSYVETEQPVFAWPEARFAGEAVAAVVAADRYAAEDAAALVVVDAEPLPAAVDVVGARGGPVVHAGAADNVLLSRRVESGEVEKALAESAVVIERAFRTNRQSAAPLEGRGGVAEWSAGEGKLTLWSGTQVPHLARHGLAEILGLAENRIRVIAPDVGGGFGVKAILYPEDVALCLLAMRLGRAVKWVEQRREGLVAAAHARDHHYAVRAGLDPVEVRRLNLVGPRDLPYTSATRLVHDSPTYPVCFEKVLEAIGYDAFRAAQARARAEGRYLGIGLANYNELTGLGQAASAGPRMPFRTGHKGVTVRMDPSGA